MHFILYLSFRNTLCGIQTLHLQDAACSFPTPASNRIKLSLKRYWKLDTCEKLQVTFPTHNFEYTDREYPLMKSTVDAGTYVAVASWFLKTREAGSCSLEVLRRLRTLNVYIYKYMGSELSSVLSLDTWIREIEFTL